MLRVFTKDTLYDLDHPVHTTRRLKHTSTGDGGHDNIDNVGRGRSGFQTVVKNEDGKSETGNGSQRKASILGTQVKGQENY